MRQSSTITKLKSLMPYFLLALLIIAAYRISGEIESILGFFGVGMGRNGAVFLWISFGICNQHALWQYPEIDSNVEHQFFSKKEKGA